MQSGFKANPLFVRLPEASEQVRGGVPPVVNTGWLYDAPCVTDAMDPVEVTLGAGLISRLNGFEAVLYPIENVNDPAAAVPDRTQLLPPPSDRPEPDRLPETTEQVLAVQLLGVNT